MYIRRKKNISGSLSIYILEKQNGKQVLIKSMGAANTESGIVRLESLARKEIERLLKQKVIEFNYDQDEQHKSFVRESIQTIRIVGTELVLVNIFNEIEFSKDGKPHCPQIVLGLLVTTGGYPLAFEIFEGNKYKGETLIPVLEHFKKRYDPSKLVVVADAGLLSKSNIEQLLNHNYEFILWARIKSETKEQKELLSAFNIEF